MFESRVEKEEDTMMDNHQVQELAHEWQLDERIQQVLTKSLSIKQFFPIQIQSIPAILKANRYSRRGKDFCISAPTGSGKTLVFVIPIIQSLLQRRVCRLRALIVLPSRDLAIQVHQVVQIFCKTTPLRCGLAIGQSNFSMEQCNLVGEKSSFLDQINSEKKEKKSHVSGGKSLVDILVATPGRLVDHLEQTKGFTLQHLQFLVIDEVDRLLSQSYQGWIQKIYQEIYWVEEEEKSDDETENNGFYNIHEGVLIDPITRRHRSNPLKCGITVPLCRILLSATLSKNPGKLASLDLKNPKILNCEELKTNHKDNEMEYTIPKNLTQTYLECESEDKPWMLVKILHQKMTSHSLTIVFTCSVNSTHRLARLLQLYNHYKDIKSVREYSSNLSQKQRTNLLKDCREGKVKILVASDAMARGMDLENVSRVINYDVPSFIKTYIHRVGRTARAERKGCSITLVKKGQLKGFWRLFKKVETNSLILIHNLETQDHDQEWLDRYRQALNKLKYVLNDEKKVVLNPQQSIDIMYQSVSMMDEKIQQNNILSFENRKRTFQILHDQLVNNLDVKEEVVEKSLKLNE